MNIGEFSVAERFVSINGEGLCQGQLAAFIRFAGCNLACTWCDTLWANKPGASVTYSLQNLVDWVAKTGVANVTLTGGEPTLQPNLSALIEVLYGVRGLQVIELETNGAVALDEFHAVRCRKEAATAEARSAIPALRFTLDCKLPDSNMNEYMRAENYDLVRAGDAVKFVVASTADMYSALEVMKRFDLCSRCAVFFSPVFGSISPASVVSFMQKHRLNDVRLGLQLHKIIWPGESKGV